MQEHVLYDGEVTISFDDRWHKYTWLETDKTIKSVTTVLRIISKPALINWAANTAVNYMEENIEAGVVYDEVELASMLKSARQAHWQRKKDAGDLGTLLHKWVEAHIKGKKPKPPVNKTLRKSVKKFLEWVKKHEVKFLLSEQVVFSRKYEYSGTTDFICQIDGKLYIGDLKTSKGIYPEMIIQTCAYRYARTEEFPQEKYDGQVIIRVGSNGTFEAVVIDEKDIYIECMKTFLSAKKLSEGMEIVENYKPGRMK